MERVQGCRCVLRWNVWWHLPDSTCVAIAAGIGLSQSFWSPADQYHSPRERQGRGLEWPAACRRATAA